MVTLDGAWSSGRKGEWRLVIHGDMATVKVLSVERGFGYPDAYGLTKTN